MHATARRSPVERLDEVRAELAAGAGGVDDGTAALDPAYDTLRRAGLLSAVVPAEFGGDGLSFLQLTRLLERLALLDGGLALGFTMHNVAIGSLCETAGTDLPPRADRFRRWLLREVVEERKLVAAATSEAATGAKLRGIGTTYRHTPDGGYELTGRKSFVSLAGVADYYVVAAAPADAEDAADGLEVSHFVVARDDPGVGFGALWDGAGLRGTATAPMSLDAVPLPADRLFLGVEGMSLFKLVREPHWMVAGYMGAYLGIAEATFRVLVAELTADPAKQDCPVVQADVGRMGAELAAARALVHSAAATVDEHRGSLEANTAVHAAKYVVGELAPRLAREATARCGSRALRRGHELERRSREATFCAVMPAKSDECLAYVGKSVLAHDMFRVDTLAW
ncbi:acyl-CoA dehydrogenase family protein [Pseudonocardia sp. HH130630-07]|uniref:acyl-CoA dehydrogenase family protein n=1 Tax=Pseudonocardia sp. HH130630-07 TaxID=1690815 RepID=UPI000814D12F|nr:acyl-CoA dehydrogenase family protein [Pseudonocardia sp. HH130630-07]ANY07732.1 acyl-CoA dehydrogenase [Pseudonocardia sp. HH130630-07]